VNSTPSHPAGPERPGVPLPADPERLAGLDPRDVILITEEVHAYYRLGRTAGYALTRGPLAPYRAAPGRWRLADLHRFQEDRLAGSVLPPLAAESVETPATPDTPTIPASRRARRADGTSP
jgi:hypothetical protein